MTTEIDREDELANIDDLFSTVIKGRVDPVFRLSRQLERCNVLMSGGDTYAFDSAVRAALSDLPIAVKDAVLVRTDEFNSMITTEIKEYWCGVVYREFDDNGEMLPLKTRDELTTDYEKLFDIIKEELERSGGSWQYEKKIFKSLKVQEALPNEIITAIVKNRVDFLLNLRATYPEMRLGLRDLNIGWDRTPATPVFKDEEVEE